MSKKIEHPKAFISYAWVSDENMKKVKDFVNRLRKDGVNTVFDQSDLKPGQSMPHYMESAVRDPDVTHVLMLLTPEYKKKADMKTGGVGTETQIISQEVYSDVENTKFVPVIFDTCGASAKECLPTYLKSRFFIDLSDPEKYESEYMRLVRTLFGAETVVLQPVGSKPGWVDRPETIDYDQNKVALLRGYKEHHNEKDVLIKADDISSTLISELRNINFEHASDLKQFDLDYGKTRIVRNTLLEIVYELLSNDGLFDFLQSFFDKFTVYCEELSLNHDLQYKFSLLKMLKHELIVAVIALLYKKQRWQIINDLITTSYISHISRCGIAFDDYFYCYNKTDVYNIGIRLNSIFSSDHNRSLLCGLADYWVHKTYNPMISGEDYANADVLISNLSYCDEVGWFPLSYPYVSEFSNWIIDVAASLTSKALSKRLMPLFGVEDYDALKKKAEQIFEAPLNGSMIRGFSATYREVPYISDYIEKRDIFSKP